jgi:hypothetical protein
MLSDPGRFAPTPYRKNRLWVARMTPARLGFPDDSLDFVALCGLERLGSEDAAAAALAECARVVKPGGVTISTTEVGLNACARAGVFLPDQLSRIVAASGLQPIEEPDFSVGDATLDAFVDLARGAGQRPHLVLASGDLLFTSAVLVLERFAAQGVGIGSG